jgi:hypothetical protein
VLRIRPVLYRRLREIPTSKMDKGKNNIFAKYFEKCYFSWKPLNIQVPVPTFNCQNTPLGPEPKSTDRKNSVFDKTIRIRSTAFKQTSSKIPIRQPDIWYRHVVSRQVVASAATLRNFFRQALLRKLGLSISFLMLYRKWNLSSYSFPWLVSTSRVNRLLNRSKAYGLVSKT